MKCWRYALLISVVLLGGCYGGSTDSGIRYHTATHNAHSMGAQQ